MSFGRCSGGAKRGATVDLIPTQMDRDLAKEVYDEYAVKPGAQHIASEFALTHLSALIVATKPQSVIEMGAGIGTMTDFLLRHPAAIPLVTTVEDNEFCLGELAKNISADYGPRYELLTDREQLRDSDQRFDLVIVDGDSGPVAYALLNEGACCFVEGDRNPVRDQICDALGIRGLACRFANYNRGKRHFVFSVRRHPRTGRITPRFRRTKIKKGCWVGQVEKLAG